MTKRGRSVTPMWSCHDCRWTGEERAAMAHNEDERHDVYAATTRPAWVCFDCGFTGDDGSNGWHDCPGPPTTKGR